MKNNLYKKGLSICMVGLLLLGNTLQTFAFTTTSTDGSYDGSNGVTDANRHIFVQIKDIMVPNIVNQVLKTFPAFSYLKDSNIEIGFEIFNDGQYAAAAMDAVPQYNPSAQDNVKDVVYSLRINSAARELAWNTNTSNFEYRDELEQLLTHEMMHAFLSEGMRSGMYGYDPERKIFDPNRERIPLWFSEGVPQAIAGDRGLADSIAMNGINATSSNEDIKYALERLNEAEVGAYGVGYLASLYFAYWTGNQNQTTISNYVVDGNTLARGLNIFMQELISGQSFDETIAEYTPYTGLADFEEKFEEDTIAYDFVRALFTARGPRRPDGIAPTGALLTNDLTAADILDDTLTAKKINLFTIHETFKSVVVHYPNEVNVMSGGSRNKSGKPPVDIYEIIPKKTNQLATPANLQFQKKNNKLLATWDVVPNASNYEVIGYRGIDIIERKTGYMTTSYEMEIPNKSGKYSVSVKAIGDKETYTNSVLVKSDDFEFVASPVLSSKTKTTIDIIKEFNHEYSIDSGSNWKSASKQDDGNIVMFDGLQEGTEYTIIARVKATTTNSLPLIVKTSTDAIDPVLPTLSSPTNVKWDITDEQAMAVWDNVTDAAVYEIQLYVNGEKVGKPITTTDLYYKVDWFTKTGEYQFKVKALANGETHQSSSESNLSQSMFYVLAPVLKTISASQIEVVAEDTLEYSIDNGTNWNSTGVFSNLSPKTTYKVIAKIKDSPKNISKMLSVMTQEEVAFKPLDAPSNVKLTRNGNKFIVSWDSVQGATDYEVTLYNGATIVSGPNLVSKRARSTQMSYEMSVPSESGTYTSRVVAVGDGNMSGSSAAQGSGQVQYVVPPLVSTIQVNQIVIKIKPNHEYSINNGVSWQDSGVFSNLKENTSYTIISRVKNTTVLSDQIVIHTKAMAETPLPPENPTPDKDKEETPSTPDKDKEETPSTPDKDKEETPSTPDKDKEETPSTPDKDKEETPSTPDKDKEETPSTPDKDKEETPVVPNNSKVDKDMSVAIEIKDVKTADTSNTNMYLFFFFTSFMVVVNMGKYKHS